MRNVEERPYARQEKLKEQEQEEGPSDRPTSVSRVLQTCAPAAAAHARLYNAP